MIKKSLAKKDQESFNESNESPDSKKKRVAEIIQVFQSEYPDPKCHLNFTTPLELLVGCILSAQCTDERINQVTRGLFEKYRTAEDYAAADQGELEGDIHSTGFFRNKAKAIIGCCRVLSEKYGGEVPASMEELTALDGVGRKTANVVLANFFGVPGIIVDTHVRRLTDRLGLSAQSDPDKIEADLMTLVPQSDWTYFSNSLGDHGRMVCKARKPSCGMCKISHLCPSAGLGQGI